MRLMNSQGAMPSGRYHSRGRQQARPHAFQPQARDRRHSRRRKRLTVRWSRRLAGLFPPASMIKMPQGPASRALVSRG